MARRSGANVAVHYSSLLQSGFASLGCFTQVDLNLARDRFEATCGGDANKTYVLGKKDASATGTMNYDDENSAIWDAVDSATPLFYRIYPDLENIPDVFWVGQFYIDASVSIPVAGVITSGFNMAAAGDIVYTTTGGPSASVSPSASASPS